MIIISFSSKDIISAIIMLTILYALLEPYIKELEKKIVTTKIELQNCVQNWIKYIKKFHIEKIDDFDMNQGEIMGFIKAVSVLVSHIPDNTNVITYTGGIGLSVNWLEELAYRCFERGLQGGCTALKNNLIEIFEKNKDNAKNVLKITGETLKNNIIVSTVIEWLPDNIKSDLSDTFNVEELSSIIDKTALKIANNKGDLEKYEKTYIHKLAGFMYTNSMDDYYYTEEGSLQSKMGFMDYYDECGKYIGMAGLQDIVVIFPYDDKEYRVEFWYGPYADGRSLGAEIGVYYRSLSDAMEKEYKYKAPDSKFIFYDCVKDATDKMRTPEKGHRPYYNQNDIKSDQFVMTLTMYMNDIELYSHTTEGHTGKEKDDDHFWCLAIRSSKLGRGEEKKLERKKMKIIGTLQKIDDPKLMDVMSKALREARIPGKRIIVNYEKSSSKIEVLFGGIYETD